MWSKEKIRRKLLDSKSKKKHKELAAKRREWSVCPVCGEKDMVVRSMLIHLTYYHLVSDLWTIRPTLGGPLCLICGLTAGRFNDEHYLKEHTYKQLEKAVAMYMMGNSS